MTKIGNIRKFRSAELWVKNECGSLVVWITYNNTLVRLCKRNCSLDLNMNHLFSFCFYFLFWKISNIHKSKMNDTMAFHYPSPSINNYKYIAKFPSLKTSCSQPFVDFVKNALLKYNSQAIKFTHDNCTVHWFLVNVWSFITIMQF